MSAVVLTISPRVPLDRAERTARGRVDRDGIAAMAATTGDGRQVAYLRRLARRLVAGGLDCQLAETGADTTYLIVRALGSARPVNFRGDPKTG